MNCRDVKDLDEMIKQECIRNKKYLDDLNTFSKKFKKYYEQKKFTLKPCRLK